MENRRRKISKKILVVAAHPDDEVLGCGATIAKHVALGNEVRVIILGEGVRARRGVKNARQKIKTLELEATKANRFLGVSRTIFLGLPDNALDNVSLLTIIQKIERIIERYMPQLVYTHHHGDVNIDHQLTARAMQAVCRPLPESSIEMVLAFEVASSTEWSFQSDRIFAPNVFYDVSGFFDKKIKAMELYQSEIRQFPHPRSSEYLRALARVRGGQAGFNFAEGFSLVYSREKQLL